MENNNINSFLQQAITKACSFEPLTQEIIITNLVIALNKLIIKLRSCTNRLKPFQQGMKSSNNTNGLGRANRYLLIFGKPAGIVEPSQGTLNNPSLGQELPLGLNAYRNINTKAQGHILLKGFAVSCIGTEPLNGWIFLKGLSRCQNT